MSRGHRQVQNGYSSIRWRFSRAQYGCRPRGSCWELLSDPSVPLKFRDHLSNFSFCLFRICLNFFPSFFLGLFSFSWRFFLTIHSLVAPLSNDNSDLFTIITLWIDRWSCISHPKFGLKIFKISKKFDIIILLDQILYLNMILTL